MSPRRRKSKSAPESSAAEPTPVAEILEQSPIARMLAEPKPEPQSPEPKPPMSHVERLSRDLPSMATVPAGFVNVDRYVEAGMRVNRSLDKNVVAIQFSEDWKASRNGLKSGIDTLEIRGFRYEPPRRQWERVDREQPGANIVDAKQLAAELASSRLGRGR